MNLRRKWTPLALKRGDDEITDTALCVEAGLLANAVSQLQMRCLAGRLRQQAGSYNGSASEMAPSCSSSEVMTKSLTPRSV